MKNTLLLIILVLVASSSYATKVRKHREGILPQSGWIYVTQEPENNKGIVHVYCHTPGADKCDADLSDVPPSQMNGASANAFESAIEAATIYIDSQFAASIMSGSETQTYSVEIAPGIYETINILFTWEFDPSSPTPYISTYETL